MCHAGLVPVFVIASALAAVAWLYLIAGHGGFWRTSQRLPPAAPPGAAPPGAAGRVVRPAARWPDVVAVVPARDEAEMLPQVLPGLLCQDYPGRLRVVLVDDESRDGTAAVAAAAAAAAAAADPRAAGRLTVIAGRPAPAGWAGKVWAMQQGVQAAGEAEYILFTDADIAHAPGTLTALVGAARDRGRALVSQMALLRTATPAERLLIPAFVYFFAMLYPFRRVSRPACRTAAAAGGCMLVAREALDAAGGLARIAGARIDDVALGALIKRSAGGDCWLGFSTDVTSLRRYERLSHIWDMVARSAYTQLRHSPAMLAATVAGLAWLFLLPVAAALAGLAMLAAAGTGPGRLGGQAVPLAVAGLAAWAIMSVTYLPVLRLCRLSALRAPALPLAAALYAAMTVSSAWRHHRGRGGAWKGRTIPRPPPGARRPARSRR